MLVNFFLGLFAMVVCLFLQGALLVVALRFYARRLDYFQLTFLSAMRVTSSMMLILILGSLAQITAWALLFIALEEFESLTRAFYFSAVNFATLGYGDIVMSEQHRVLGPLEALNGALMIGLSTATLSWVFQELIRHGRQSQDISLPEPHFKDREPKP